MQAQDDPFHVGGSITPSKLTLAMIVTHLVTGYACMDFLSFFAWDWSLVKGKLGCRPGAFVLYFGCRYLGILSVVSTVLFLDTFPMVFLDPLRYISEVTAGFALGLAYCIFLLRIAFMFKRLWLCVLADIVKFTFLGLMIKGMTEIPAVLRDGPGVSFTQAIFGLTVTTLLFLSTLVRALYVCRQEHAFKFWACLDVCRREDVIEFGLVWASTALMSVSRNL
ncbi:hypothetical protein C8Q77DRAFT_1220250 [Trametes polyzona]|nr:hypothetical protein C8Q77DRAFT_1220250 [Trametes polyzona]